MKTCFLYVTLVSLGDNPLSRKVSLTAKTLVFPTQQHIYLFLPHYKIPYFNVPQTSLTKCLSSDSFTRGSITYCQPSFTHSLINDPKKILMIAKRAPPFHCTSGNCASLKAKCVTTVVFTVSPKLWCC